MGQRERGSLFSNPEPFIGKKVMEILENDLMLSERYFRLQQSLCVPVSWFHRIKLGNEIIPCIRDLH